MPKPTPPPRILFLDDDPARAATFLESNPDAVWVQTVPECLARLAEPWDEVHLDHDLGGEHFVDVNREDCGMEVVRWLALEPRRHLGPARFTVHSHNMAAAFEMVLRLQSLGHKVEARPFGITPPPPEPSPPGRWHGLWPKARAWARQQARKLRGADPLDPPDPESPDYVP